MREFEGDMLTTTEKGDNDIWYALRVTYCRELAVQKQLDGRGIESYVPMHIVEQSYGVVKRKVRVPLIHNLLFVRISAEVLKRLKTTTTLPIQYIMDRASGTPAVIPDEEMRNFILATRDDKAEIADPQNLQLTQGDHVRVKEGVFAGVEGYYIREKGRGKVAVEIRGIATVLTAYIPAKFLEKYNTNK